LTIITSFIFSLLLILILYIFQRRKATSDPEYQKFVAYHEAGHAVLAIYLGFRCTGVILNVTKSGAQIIRHHLKGFYGVAYVDISNFDSQFALIRNSTIINLNIDKLPKDEQTINFAKNYLAVIYAGDIIVKKIFNVPDSYLRTMRKGLTIFGEDLHSIENLHDYLAKVKNPLPAENVKHLVLEIFEKNKEVRAAVHFLADAMLKNPGDIITEKQIIDNLTTVNFFTALRPNPIQMYSYVTSELANLISQSRVMAISLGHNHISTIHLFLTDCESERNNSIFKFGFKDKNDYFNFKSQYSVSMGDLSLTDSSLPLTEEAAITLKLAEEERLLNNQWDYYPSHFFIAALKNKESMLFECFRDVDEALDKLITYYRNLGEFERP